MFDKTVTLFNYHASTKRWHITTLQGVNFNDNRAAKATQQGVTNGDTVSLLLPVDISGGSISYEGKLYVKPKEYAALDNPADVFTLTPETDFFVVGNCRFNTPIDESEYMDGFYTEMNAELDDVYLITSAAFFSLIPHFEIGGS